MRLPRTWLCLALAFIIVPSIHGQDSTVLRIYETNVYNNDLARRGLHRNEDIANINRRLKYKEKRKQWEVLTLPLVFHVVYREGTVPHSEAEIERQVTSLNADFAAGAVPEAGQDPRDPDGAFRSKSVDAKIRFCYPAKVRTKQRKGERINYIPLGPADTTNVLSLREENGLAPPFNTNKYINVWIVPEDMIRTGFAQYPGGDKASDGIVISRSFFGLGTHNHPGYDKGKTLTHLMGNYLGLRPIWGD